MKQTSLRFASFLLVPLFLACAPGAPTPGSSSGGGKADDGDGDWEDFAPDCSEEHGFCVCLYESYDCTAADQTACAAAGGGKGNCIWDKTSATDTGRCRPDPLVKCESFYMGPAHCESEIGRAHV